MTADQLINRTLEGVGEDTSGPVYYQPAEALVALNQAERIFCALTLCLETSGGYQLEAGEAWQDLRSVFPDIIAPLRISQFEGVRLRPSTLSQLDALGNTWQAEVGDPLAYSALGPSLLAIYPHPDEEGSALEVVFAHEPAPMVGDAESPKIPAVYHPMLIDYAVSRLRAKEGGDEFMSALWRLERFLDAVSTMGNLVRERSRAKRYDVIPFEMNKKDRVAFIKQIRKAANIERQSLVHAG